MLHDVQVPVGWRLTAPLAIAAFLPVTLTILMGQLAPVLLFVFWGAFQLHRQKRLLQAGAVFSLLALKPQMAIGVVVWLLLRHDLRTITGLFLGLLLQVGLLTLFPGPQVPDRLRRESPPAFGIVEVDRLFGLRSACAGREPEQPARRTLREFVFPGSPDCGLLRSNVVMENRSIATADRFAGKC